MHPPVNLPPPCGPLCGWGEGRASRSGSLLRRVQGVWECDSCAHIVRVRPVAYLACACGRVEPETCPVGQLRICLAPGNLNHQSSDCCSSSLVRMNEFENE